MGLWDCEAAPDGLWGTKGLVPPLSHGYVGQDCGCSRPISATARPLVSGLGRAFGAPGQGLEGTGLSHLCPT